jgi:hypothetical protein
MDLIKQFADESGQGVIFSYGFVNQIVFSKTCAPLNDSYRWISAAREYLEGRHGLLEIISNVMDALK